jgi:hypothetical protein
VLAAERFFAGAGIEKPVLTVVAIRLSSLSLSADGITPIDDESNVSPKRER